jgi:hypothetical protein
MLGLLLHRAGVPDRGDFEDMMLRWIVCGHDGVDDDPEHEPTDRDAQKVGNLLVEVFIHSFWNEEHDGELVDGPQLRAVVYRGWKQAFVPRITRALKKRGIAFSDRFDEDDLLERFNYDWLESVDVTKLALPKRQAQKLGEALGSHEASSTLALWTYMEKMDREQVSV